MPELLCAPMNGLSIVAEFSHGKARLHIVCASCGTHVLERFDMRLPAASLGRGPLRGAVGVGCASCGKAFRGYVDTSIPVRSKNAAQWVAVWLGVPYNSVEVTIDG